MLFNEPKLLKSGAQRRTTRDAHGFSALQRAEIAEICRWSNAEPSPSGFSALQRAEIAEMREVAAMLQPHFGFSALQRAEIAEICLRLRQDG